MKNPSNTEIIPKLDPYRDREELERLCLSLQHRQQSFIDTNRRLMESGKIEFDEYDII